MRGINHETERSFSKLTQTEIIFLYTTLSNLSHKLFQFVWLP